MERPHKKKLRYKDVLFSSEKKTLSSTYMSFPFYHMRKGSQYSKHKDDRDMSKEFQLQEDYHASKMKIFDPDSRIMQQWNKVFLLSCLVALFVDPFFFFLPVIGKNGRCIKIEKGLEIAVTVVRTITDTFYLLHIGLQFRTGFVAPYSKVFGRGVLVVDSMLIAKRYLSGPFWLDLLAVLPVPQVTIWLVVGFFRTTPPAYFTKNALRFIIFFQFFPRLYLVYKLLEKIVKSTGVVTKTAWAGAAYNLALYILASHLIGASWYFLSIERIDTCWRRQCRKELGCDYPFLYCEGDDDGRLTWNSTTNIYAECLDQNIFDLGIYEELFDKSIGSAKFLNKYLYCLWFGLRQLSSLGQGLETSTFAGEIIFAVFVAIVGLVLFALLIGNMQAYLQSLGVRAEEWRVKQSDTEEWMQHRQLPEELRGRVREYNQCKWIATRGVDEDSLLKSLPTDLHRDIKRHLCLNLVKKVPLFREMDDSRLLDAVCVRLKPVLRTKDSVIMREGDPVNEMLFIIRGKLDSVTTNGGRTGFFNQIKLGQGSFCGEELLTWVLDPKPSLHLPNSTRTIVAESEVEAFSLTADDLKFVAKQYRHFQSKKLQYTFRVYSPQWQTRAACVIQAAWKRFKKRKSLSRLCSLEESAGLASHRNSSDTHNHQSNATRLKRPEDPDYSADGDYLPSLLDI